MRDITYYLGKKLVLNRFLYLFLNLTWGLLTTLVGYLVLIVLLPFGKVRKHNGILYLAFKHKSRSYYGWGFSIGMVFFTYTAEPDRKLMDHEYGHTVQNAIFGPLMPFIVLIPSGIRFWYRRIFKIKTPYDSIWFEETATSIGDFYYSFALFKKFLGE